MAQLEQAPDGKPMLTVTDADDLQRWLDAEHDRPSGVWLVRSRKGSDHPRIEYDDTIEALLSVGWVDAVVKVLDERRFILWISPRRKGSVWSKPNKERVEQLEADGRMRPSGRAAVERAKADGTWTVLDSAERLEVPDDLATALEATPPARENFDAFPPSTRKVYLSQVAVAKTAPTRARRIAEVARRSAANLRPGA